MGSKAKFVLHFGSVADSLWCMYRTCFLAHDLNACDLWHVQGLRVTHETHELGRVRKTLKQSAAVAGLLAATSKFPQYAFAAFNKSAFEANS